MRAVSRKSPVSEVMAGMVMEPLCSAKRGSMTISTVIDDVSAPS